MLEHMAEYLTALVTFIVGLVALEVYQKQKRDFKKTAARILLIEIENAERQLQVINQNGEPKNLAENLYLMPSASWEKYRHLFAQDFTPREWDTITNFYNRCLQFDEAVKYDSVSFKQDIEAFRTSINAILAAKAGKMIEDLSQDATENELAATGESYRKFRDELSALYMTPSNLHMYSPQKPVTDAVAAIKNLDGGLSLTTVGVKLRKLAKQGFFARLFNQR
jgi:hypothetical protein